MSLKARSSVPGEDLVGLTVDFGPGPNNSGNDLAGSCANQGLEPFYCPNRTGLPYRYYRVEVVDRVGNDSFAPGHGVIIAKSRNRDTPRVWMIDPKPQDIGMIDFYRPDGTPVAVVRGDPRQLNDATFHAGTNSGSAYDYVDTFNSLHFYVLRTYRNAQGVLFYDVAARRTDGRPVHAGSRARQSVEEGAAAGLPRHVFVPAHEHRPGRHRHLRLGRLPALGELQQPGLEGDAAERAGLGDAGPDRADPRPRAA